MPTTMRVLARRENCKLDAIIDTAQRPINPLPERQTALISAAVTEQNNLRGVKTN